MFSAFGLFEDTLNAADRVGGTLGFPEAELCLEYVVVDGFRNADL